MVDVTVKSQDIDNLVRAIREHADAKALRKEMYSGLNRVTKSIRQQMKENVNESTTPTSGGLTALMTKRTRITSYIKPGKWAGMGIKARGPGSLAAMNFKGTFRHPTPAGVWVPQSAGVHKGLLSEKFDSNKPAIQRAMQDVLEQVARKVTDI